MRALVPAAIFGLLLVGGAIGYLLGNWSKKMEEDVWLRCHGVTRNTAKLLDKAEQLLADISIPTSHDVLMDEVDVLTSKTQERVALLREQIRKDRKR